jgi:3-hydroxyacyl-CoA dehydrogenase
MFIKNKKHKFFSKGHDIIKKKYREAIMSKIQYSVHSSVAVIQLDNPPLNPLSYELRSSITNGIDTAIGDANVKAIVLIGNERAFSSGADISEFGTALSYKEPHLISMINVIENSPKPVIAAISGACMGGGLETAMGCHFRVAKPDASISQPEVKLGIIPGGGGTQRLPRLAGLEVAVNMIVSGNTVPAVMLKDTKLFDEIIPGDLLAGAIAFADKVIAEQRVPKLARDMRVNYPLAEGYLQFARNTISVMSKNYPAPLQCVEAIAASTALPFAKGMEKEREIFVGLMNSPESQALRHVFFAERAASKISDVSEETPVRKIEQVAVIGAGTMGGGIAMNFLNAGVPVTIVESKQEALDHGVGVIAKNYEGSVKKGKLKPEKVEQLMGLLTPTLSMDDVKDADLIIEAVFEDMGVKEEVFKKLDAVAKFGAILASNTSTLDINKIASFTNRPGDVLGMHFFSPANVMKLLEVVRGEATSTDVMATVMQLCKKIKKTGVVSGVCDGFIGNRMIAQYANMAFDLIEQGATPAQVDQALEKWGMVMGPFRISDLAGNDIGWAIRKRHYAEHADAKKFVIGDRLCEMGRFGQKTGSGWYLYEPGKRDPVVDPVVTQLIEDYRREAGIAPRNISDQEIVERCIYALVNEGARILEEGIAARSSDIDIVYIYGYGFPPFRGGPMNYANQVGLYNVVRRMRQFAGELNGNSTFWQPAALIERLAAEGKEI